MTVRFASFAAGTLLACLLTSWPASGQIVDQYNPPKAGCCLQFTAQALADQLQDWNQLGRYYADNERLKALAPEAGRVVFMGDSITDGWKLAQQFPGKPYVNRGISGQTTQQMLVRMYPDVVALKPAAMIVLAGTNDIARNTGPVTMSMITDNIRAMTVLAKASRIKVILCSVMPVSDYTQRKQTDQRPPADILKLNAWMKEFAAAEGLIYVDYFSAMVDGQGLLKDGISGDGLHPNQKGYDMMAPLAEAGIQAALK
ncbi:SGNH/GDSL hydrolase family protein [Paludibaculum fermentans]|uniref:SGNH/GDSL hydrolase family protein n=1 Tax=Paludibaculum fermentans TaxID=1473598 RepID=A0A7S7NVK7_PALFE|nr:SGNH/GDSL hydrolase family protein [Paludibaculum fermentans]QOY90612.1 SGNH/GDSL hydrolase family protein [Paludibaculum fermentans]